MIATVYQITHGQEYADYGELSDIFNLIEKNYHFSSPHCWMWKAFQIGVEYGKRLERKRRRRT